MISIPVTQHRHGAMSGVVTNPPLVRSTLMMLLNESLARARMREMEAEAEYARRIHHLITAKRRQRRAKGTARRARQAQSVS